MQSGAEEAPCHFNESGFLLPSHFSWVCCCCCCCFLLPPFKRPTKANTALAGNKQIIPAWPAAELTGTGEG